MGAKWWLADEYGLVSVLNEAFEVPVPPQVETPTRMLIGYVDDTRVLALFQFVQAVDSLEIRAPDEAALAAFLRERGLELDGDAVNPL